MLAPEDTTVKGGFELTIEFHHVEPYALRNVPITLLLDEKSFLLRTTLPGPQDEEERRCNERQNDRERPEAPAPA